MANNTLTNRERLRLLTNEEYATEIATYDTCTVKPFVDYEKWLNSTSDEYPIVGTPAVLKEDNGQRVECTLVNQKEQTNGTIYGKLVVKLPGLHNFKTIFVPMEKVEIL